MQAVDNVTKGAGVACKTVDLGDNQRIALAQELERTVELLPIPQG